VSRTMYDSTDAVDIPKTAKMVAGYIDGTSFKWTPADWARFPKATKVEIARRTHTNDGHVLDVEEGIPTVWPINGSIVDWVLMRRQAGVEPAIYCNQLNDWGPLKNLFDNADVRHPLWWVARYDNKKTIPPGAIAKQYANPPLAGGHYDLSIVADYWPGVDRKEDADMDMNTVLPPTKMADGKVYNGLTVGDVLSGMAQYIPANGDTSGALTAHAAGSYQSRILAIDAIKATLGGLSDNDAAILAAIQEDDENETSGIDVFVLAEALSNKLGPMVGQELLDALRSQLNK